MSAVAGGASSKANGKVAAGKGGAGKAAGNSGGKKGANSSNKTASSTDPAAVTDAGTGAATDANGSNSSEQPALVQYSLSSKPDRELYNGEQDGIKAQIAAKQAQLDKVRAKISDSTGGGSGPLAEKRKALRAEQQELRSKTAGFKTERNETLNQLKALQDNVAKKIKDVNTAKSKTSYKSVAEIDNRIKDLEKQVETGQMRLVEEKRALSEISDLRRSRKAFDTFSTSQDSIDSDKAKIDELKTKLDNPEYKSLQGRYEEITKELEELNAELDKNGQSRDKLFDERNKLQEEVNKLWSRKKESAASFKDANDKYYTKMNDERQNRQERQQAERRAYEDTKRREANEKALEEARLPAFGREIEDCTTLINYFSRFASTGSATNVPEPTLKTQQQSSSNGSGPAGVPKLEIRQVDSGIPEGAVMMKKAEEDFFVGSGKGKKGGRKGAQQGGGAGAEKAKEASQTLNVPFQTVAALLQFNITAPMSRDDAPKTVDALQEKKSWFEANNEKVTKERIAQAEERIRKLEEKTGAGENGAAENAKEGDAATADAVEDVTEEAGKMNVENGGKANDA